MEYVAAISAAAELAGQVGSVVLSLNSLRHKFQTADKSIRRLVNKLELLKEEIEQLQEWLKKDRLLSSELQTKIQQALQGCIDIVIELSQQVEKLHSAAGTDQQPTIATRLSYMWKEARIDENERQVTNQFEAIHRLIAAVKLNDVGSQERQLRKRRTRRILEVTEKDADSIRSSRSDAGSVYTAAPSIPRNLDAEIFKSGPYRGHFNPSSLMVPQDGRSMAWAQHATETIPEDQDAQTNPISDSPVRRSMQSERNRERSSQERPRPKRFSSSNSLILSFKSKVSENTKSLTKSLADACASGNTGWVQDLIEQGAYVDGGQDTNQSPIVNAVQSQGQSHEVVKVLLEAGAKVNVRDADGRTPLFYAMQNNDIETVRLLLGAKAKFDAPDRAFSEEKSDAITALAYAAHTQRVELARMLIEHGAEVNSARSKLHLPSRDCLTPIERVYGPGVASNLSALHFAAAAGSPAMVQLLVSHGANASALCQFQADKSEDEGMRRAGNITPLHLANGPIGMILVQNEGRIFATDSNGRQPIHWAALARQADAVAFHLANGVEVDCKDAKGRTPLLLFLENLGQQDGWMKSDRLRNVTSFQETVSTLQVLVLRGADLSSVEAYRTIPCPLKSGHAEWTWADQIVSFRR